MHDSGPKRIETECSERQLHGKKFLRWRTIQVKTDTAADFFFTGGSWVLTKMASQTSEIVTQQQTQNGSSENEEYHSEEEDTVEETAGGKKKIKFPCIRCQENVSKNGVQCTSCRLWVHIPCQKILKDLYKILKDPKKFPGVAWYCDSCQASSVRLDARVRVMEGNLAGGRCRGQDCQSGGKREY